MRPDFILKLLTAYLWSMVTVSRCQSILCSTLVDGRVVNAGPEWHESKFSSYGASPPIRCVDRATIGKLPANKRNRVSIASAHDCGFLAINDTERLHSRMTRWHTDCRLTGSITKS